MVTLTSFTLKKKNIIILQVKTFRKHLTCKKKELSITYDESGITNQLFVNVPQQ